MATYLLIWNPELWPWETFLDDAERASRGDIVEMEWETGNAESITPGDRLFLFRQDAERPGIVGAGQASRRPAPVHPFDEIPGAKRDRALVTVVRFDQLLPGEEVLETTALEGDPVLKAVGWRPGPSRLHVQGNVGSALEARWTQHLTALGRPTLDDHDRFRAFVERALEARPRLTPLGRVLATTRVARFGTRRGAHAPTACWVYERRDTALALWFGFYENFTSNDLICKIVEKGDTPNGAGATIQFNGSESVASHYLGGFEFRHNGNVTVGTRIARADLVELIEATSPREAEHLGGFDARTSWPFRLGTTDHLDTLLDRLFDYAVVIEQAKRRRRNEPLLPALPASGREEASGRGQGYGSDSVTNSVVETHAMDLARRHFEGMGFQVSDHSAHASYDLYAERRGEVFHIEVKGTQGDGSAVLLTANEVAHARSHHPNVALVVVAHVEVCRGPEPVARGGQLRVFSPWDPDEHALVPMAFRCELDRCRGLEATD